MTASPSDPAAYRLFRLRRLSDRQHFSLDRRRLRIKLRLQIAAMIDRHADRDLIMAAVDQYAEVTRQVWVANHYLGVENERVPPDDLL